MPTYMIGEQDYSRAHVRNRLQRLTEHGYTGDCTNSPRTLSEGDHKGGLEHCPDCEGRYAVSCLANFS